MSNIKKCNSKLAWHDGSCCCNCEHQKKLMCHPWNKGFGEGEITSKKHGFCELWTARETLKNKYKMKKIDEIKLEKSHLKDSKGEDLCFGKLSIGKHISEEELKDLMLAYEFKNKKRPTRKELLNYCMLLEKEWMKESIQMAVQAHIDYYAKDNGGTIDVFAELNILSTEENIMFCRKNIGGKRRDEIIDL